MSIVWLKKVYKGFRGNAGSRHLVLGARCLTDPLRSQDGVAKHSMPGTLYNRHPITPWTSARQLGLTRRLGVAALGHAIATCIRQRGCPSI